MLALILALTLLHQPTPTQPSLPPSPPKAPQHAGGPAGTPVVEPDSRPAALSPLDRLSPSDRRAVEAAAPFYFRFADGSVWSRQVEEELQKLPKNTRVLPAFQQGDAPLWSDIAHSAVAKNETEIFDWIDAADISKQAADQGLHTFRNAVVLQITEGGVIVAAGDPRQPFFLTGWEGQSRAVDGSEIKHLYAKRSGRHQYTSAAGTLSTVERYESHPLRSRLPREKYPITPEKLADLLERGALPGLTTWTPVKTDNRAALEQSKYSPSTAAALTTWSWKPRTTRLKFKAP